MANKPPSITLHDFVKEHSHRGRCRIQNDENIDANFCRDLWKNRLIDCIAHRTQTILCQQNSKIQHY
jgi:hypothetical protein